MNILHLIGYLGKAQGGPVESLRLLASAQAEIGHSVHILHTGIPGDGELARFPENVNIINASSYGPFRWAPKLTDAAYTNGFEPDVIHSHGLWLDVNRQAGRLSEKLRVPHVISPCGMLHRDALQRSKWKKRFLWFGFQKRVLLSAEIIHAKSDAEASEIIEHLPKAKIKIVPNPIEPPPGNVNTKAQKSQNSYEEQLFTQSGIQPNHRVLLFLGRIHPVKGLDRLLRAWLRIFEKFAEWRLVIVGPDEDGYRAKLIFAINEEASTTDGRGKNNDVWSTVRFVGPIYGQGRWQAYGRADLFVAPSHFENFGRSIAEALSVGVPVITTTGTPWKELEEKGCGWWIDPSPRSIASALEEAMRLPDTERKAKGQIGRRLSQRYFPRKIAKEMYLLYESLLSKRRGKDP